MKRGSKRGFAQANPHGAFGALSTTLGAGAIVQGLAALAGFAVLPILIQDLGSAAFGVLVVIVSLGPWLTIVDGALYPSTRLVVGELRGAAGGGAPAPLLRSARRFAYRVMAANAIVVVLCLAVLPVETLFGAEGTVPFPELLAAVALFTLPVIATGPGGVYLGALEGVGRTVVAAVILGLGPILALPLSWAVASSGGGLVPLAFIQGLAIGIPRAFAWIYWFWRPSVAAPHLELDDAGIRPRLIAQMALLSALSLAQTGLAPVIVSSQVGADAAASFGMAWRFVNGALIPLMILTPLFAGSIAAARGAGWAGRSDGDLRRLIAQAAVVGGVAGLCLVVLGPPLTDLLGGGEVEAPLNLYLAGAAFLLGMYVSTPLALAFSSPRALRVSVALNCVLAVFNIALSFWLAPRIGPAGPLWASALSTWIAATFWVLMWVRRPALLTEVHNPIATSRSRPRHGG